MRPETVGILPAGALGVSFFYYLTGRLTRPDGSVSFLTRAGSASLESLRRTGTLRIEDDLGVQAIDIRALIQPDMLAAHLAGTLPELLLVCPNPDQLLSVVTSYVALLEKLGEEELLESVSNYAPCLILCSNGIYFQRIRQIFVEKIEESILLGRLPDLWPDIMPKIVGRLLRGVSIQTGLREGEAATAIYRPGPRGITRLAGGDSGVRERSCRILSEKGAWVELASYASATRLEFDKAIVNLTTNLLGQIYAIDDTGRFRALRVSEIVAPAHEPEIRELAREVFRVGQAVKAYGKSETLEPVYEDMIKSCLQHSDHIPSSLQWAGLRLRLGELTREITPTETWLLDPLIRYARAAELETAVLFFEMLKARLADKLALAARRMADPPHDVGPKVAPTL